jgi:hypothetical protein
MLQPQLQVRDFIVVRVGNQPGVGVPSVVAVFHDACEIVNVRGILQGFARALEFRNPVRIEAREMSDGGFRDGQAGAVDAKVVATVY